MDSLTSDLENKKHDKRPSRLASVVAVSLAVGLLAGVVGAVYIAPQFQDIGAGSVNTSERKVVLDEESAVIEAVKDTVPSVVSIVVTKDLPRFEQFGSPFGDFFFSVPSGETESRQVGAGSGFFIREDGWIVTNKHVVVDTEAEYTAITKDGEKLPAEVLATDPFNDLAIVKVEGTDFPVLKLGDSDNLQLGQRVIAIGNALGEFQNTVTTGVVSGVNRNITASGTGVQTESLSEVIQTDAAINPGNSGGPLLDLAGRVIGVNTAISQQAQLIGFAIPVSQVKKVISDVEEHGKVLRPFLGVRYTVITESFAQLNQLPVSRGVLLVSGQGQSQPAVQPGSPAAGAGLAEGDIILEIDGQEITPDRHLTDILRGFEPGERAVLKVLKADGAEQSLSVTLGEAQ